MILYLFLYKCAFLSNIQKEFIIHVNGINHAVK